MKTEVNLSKIIEKYKSNFLSDEYQKHHSKILNHDFYNVRKNIIKHSFPLLYADKTIWNLILEKISQFKFIQNSFKLKHLFDVKLKTDDYLLDELAYFLCIDAYSPKYVKRYFDFNKSLKIIEKNYSLYSYNYIQTLEFNEEELQMFFNTTNWLISEALKYKIKMIDLFVDYIKFK